MIKRIRFATKRHDLPAADFERAWHELTAAPLEAPPEARPARVTVSTTLPGDRVRHHGVALEWFRDEAHLGRFEAWLAGPDGAALDARADRILLVDASPLIVADEIVVRGADWLERRWSRGTCLKHMALAVRASGLSPAECSERWRGHAGRARRGDASAASPIPDAALGRAYVQDHPRPLTEGTWAYDAVNEVYFDDLAGLRRRLDWFRDNRIGQAPDELFSASWFLAVREEVVTLH